MQKERFAVIGITVLLLLGVAYFGLVSYMGAKRDQALGEFNPPPAVNRYEKLAQPDHTAVDTPSTPVEDAMEREAFDRETVAKYDTLLTVRQETLDHERWGRLYDRLIDSGIDSLSPEEFEDLRSLLEDSKDLLDLARELAKRGGPVHALKFEDGIAMELPHLAPMRDLAGMLSASAQVHARSGDIEMATAEILAIMELADTLEDEPIVISQLVRWAMYRVAIDSVERSFAPGEYPDSYAEQVALRAAQGLGRDALRAAFETERYMMTDYISQSDAQGWANHEDIFGDNSFVTRTARWVYDSPVMQPWRDMDAIAYSEIITRHMETLDVPYYEAIPSQESIEEDFEDLSMFHIGTRATAQAIGGIVRGQARLEAQIDLLTIGLAVENYQQETGSYPETLADLPMAQRIDPYSGEPYRYSVTAGGFLLYSVGTNLADDGGLHEFNTGDIVWRGQLPEKNAPKKQQMVASTKS